MGGAIINAQGARPTPNIDPESFPRDSLLIEVQIDAARFEVLDRAEQIDKRAPEAVDSGGEESASKPAVEITRAIVPSNAQGCGWNFSSEKSFERGGCW